VTRRRSLDRSVCGRRRLRAIAVTRGLVAAPGTGWIATAGAQSASTTASIRSCGHVDTYVAIGAHRVSRTKARAVARAYLHGNQHPSGFHCRRITVNAAAGWYAHCTRRASFVNVVPE
jgi:stage V sporulation protein SpoVS